MRYPTLGVILVALSTAPFAQVPSFDVAPVKLNNSGGAHQVQLAARALHGYECVGARRDPRSLGSLMLS
jgi:hypothetical protein